jgi:hypothetical protein
VKADSAIAKTVELTREGWIRVLRDGKITGGIISPAEDTDDWKALSE